jgi:hypothetical protein
VRTGNKFLSNTERVDLPLKELCQKESSSMVRAGNTF